MLRTELIGSTLLIGPITNDESTLWAQMNKIENDSVRIGRLASPTLLDISGKITKIHEGSGLHLELVMDDPTAVNLKAYLKNTALHIMEIDNKYYVIDLLFLEAVINETAPEDLEAMIGLPKPPRTRLEQLYARKFFALSEET